MSEGRFTQSIRSSYDLFNDLGRVRGFRQPTSLLPTSTFNEIALDPGIPYADVFKAGLRLNHYNLLLVDLSYFQFSRDHEGELRLAFYPSPYGPREFARISEFTRLLDNDVIDEQTYSQLMDSVATNSRRPLVRYEYSKKQYVAGKHPASHIHFGTYGDDRWVVKRVLTPLAFSALIARLYFSEDWESVTTHDQASVRRNELDDLYFGAKHACEFTDDELFGPHEERQFHFL
jgi:hypothetical protein